MSRRAASFTTLLRADDELAARIARYHAERLTNEATKSISRNKAIVELIELALNVHDGKASSRVIKLACTKARAEERAHLAATLRKRAKQEGEEAVASAFEFLADELDARGAK